MRWQDMIANMNVSMEHESLTKITQNSFGIQDYYCCFNVSVWERDEPVGGVGLMQPNEICINRNTNYFLGY